MTPVFQMALTEGSMVPIIKVLREFHSGVFLTPVQDADTNVRF